MKQGDAVRAFIIQVLTSKGIDYKLNGDEAVKSHYNNFKDEVKKMLFDGFKSETIDMKTESKKKYLSQYGGSDTELKIYVSGLLNNWVRKDKSFNSGNSYQIKNPGSRSGNSDAQVKALKQVLKRTDLTAEARQTVQAALNERLSQIKPATAKVQINLDVLPEHIRALVTE